MTAAVERRTYTPAECAQILGVSEQAVRDECRSGRIQGIKFGGRWLVPRSELERVTGESMSAATDVESGWSPERAARLSEARRLAVEITSRQERLNALLSELEGE